MPPKPTGCESCFLLVWLLGWTAVVLSADAMLGWALFRQTRALSFPTAQAVVTRSAVKASGENNRLDLSYDYTVDGRRYTGTRYSYYKMATNTWAWQKVSEELPVGTVVAVAYNPDDPAESLVRPGLTGFHLMMVWFFTPFNVVMLGGWAYFARTRRPAFDPADRRTVAPTATGWRVRVPGLGPTACFGVGLLAITFAGTFVWACGCGFNPPVTLAGPAYLTAVAFAVLAGRLAERPWFEVDEVARVLRLPAVAGTTYEVPFAAIQMVTVTYEETRDSDGDVSKRYHCELIRAGAPLVRVATYTDSEPADALAAWLRERIGSTA